VSRDLRLVAVAAITAVAGLVGAALALRLAILGWFG
jgi:hypothetical protein